MLATQLAPILALLLLNGEPDSSSEDLELAIKTELSAFETETRFTLSVVAENGRVLTHSVGESTLETPYESASTSKWVTATVLMSLVEDGVMSLDDRPQDYIDAWPTTGNLSQISLTDLLSFTSGLNSAPACINIAIANFEPCVLRIANENSAAELPGQDFYYSATHMQVAGLMAVKALGVSTWGEVFNQFKTRFDVFENSSYNLPSTSNPRLAGGMTWSAQDYRTFLAKYSSFSILNQTSVDVMSTNQAPSANIVSSPGLESWRYGLGLWLECLPNALSCTQANRLSSPGAFGAYPFIDTEHNYFGIIARQGELGTFENGYAIFTQVQQLLESWAISNQN